MKKISFVVLVAAVTLVACGNKDVAESAPKKPDVPSISYSELTELTKNERQELERRCLGVDHPTCTELKGSALKNWIELEISSCKVSAAMTGFSDRYAGRQEEAKCDDLR